MLNLSFFALNTIPERVIILVVTGWTFLFCLLETKVEGNGMIIVNRTRYFIRVVSIFK